MNAATTDSATSLGMVVRDLVGDVLMAATRRISSSMKGLYAEAEVVRFGITYAFDAGFWSVTVETDCLALVNLLQKERVERTSAQVLVDDILAKSLQFNFLVENITKLLTLWLNFH